MTAPPMPLVAVVILNWNGRKYLEEFMPSVYHTTYSNYILYVADNGSTDDSIDYLLTEGFEMAADGSDAPRQIIKMPENYGFAGGYNVALKQVKLRANNLVKSLAMRPPVKR